MNKIMNMIRGLFGRRHVADEDTLPDFDNYVNSTTLDDLIDAKIADVVTYDDYSCIHPDKGGTPLPSTADDQAHWAALITRANSETARHYLTITAQESHELCEMRDLVDATFGETSQFTDQLGL
jgi:hypothetical protein